MTTENTYYTRYDLSNLRDAIKAKAAQTRSDRNAARKLTGMDRHYALEAAKDTNTRELLLAYGLLRGKSISVMESSCADPVRRPDWSSIKALMLDYAVVREGEEYPLHQARLETILEAAEANFKSWGRSLALASLTRQAEGRAA